MKYPFLSTYCNLFNNSNDCKLTSFTNFEFSYNKNIYETIKSIDYIDYIIIYNEYELDKFKKYEQIFDKLLNLHKIYFISNYDKSSYKTIIKYEKYMFFGFIINLNCNNKQFICNLPNKIINLYIEKCIVLKQYYKKINMINYIPNSCITIDIDIIKEYKIINLPNKLKIFNIIRSWNYNKKLKLPIATILILRSNLLNYKNKHNLLFNSNKNNKIVIDYFTDSQIQLDYSNNNKFCKNIIVKNDIYIGLYKINYNIFKINDDEYNNDDAIFISSKIKDFFKDMNNSKYIWKYFTNTFIDIIDNEYYAYYIDN
jgi:hypothetical protein